MWYFFLGLILGSSSNQSYSSVNLSPKVAFGILIILTLSVGFFSTITGFFKIYSAQKELAVLPSFAETFALHETVTDRYIFLCNRDNMCWNDYKKAWVEVPSGKIDRWKKVGTIEPKWLIDLKRLALEGISSSNIGVGALTFDHTSYLTQ